MSGPGGEGGGLISEEEVLRVVLGGRGGSYEWS